MYMTNPEYSRIVDGMKRELEAAKNACGYTPEIDEGVRARWNKRLNDLKRWAAEKAKQY